jgi:hypothetical protein
LLQVFTTRGLDQMAANADALRQQVEEFKALVPLVQVRAIAGSGASIAGLPQCVLARLLHLPADQVYLSSPRAVQLLLITQCHCACTGQNSVTML